MERFDLYKDGRPLDDEIEAKTQNIALKKYRQAGKIIDFWPESGRVEFPDGSMGEIIPENLW